MIDFFMNNMNVLIFTKASECSLLGVKFTQVLDKVFTWVQIAVPCLTLVLCSVDMAQAVISQEDRSIKSAQSKCIKRLIIGVAIFFIPIIINLLLNMAGFMAGTCEIGG